MEDFGNPRPHSRTEAGGEDDSGQGLAQLKPIMPVHPLQPFRVYRLADTALTDEQRRDEDFEQGVMVDVGLGAGALVIYTPEELRGQEIEISPVGSDSARTHTDVLRRRTAAGYVDAAVFGSLPEGEYRLWHDSLASPLNVSVVGDQVTELDWR
jgi:hypothetical protein